MTSKFEYVASLPFLLHSSLGPKAFEWQGIQYLPISFAKLPNDSL